MKNKNLIPSLEQRDRDWLHKLNYTDDEIDLIINVRLMPEWESLGYTTSDVESFRCKMNQGLPKNREEDITDDDLLLDGLSEEFPGDECILKGLKRPNDNTIREINKRRKQRKLKAIYPLTDSVKRTRNGAYIKVSGSGEIKVGSTDLCRLPEWKKSDRRKSRHNGKAECREIPDIFVDAAEEENREFYKEKADGTVDVDFCLRHNWLYADLDDGIYGEEYDEEDDDYEPEYMSREWCEMECIDYDDDYDENSRLKRQINLYNDFLGEFNLKKLYQTWLDQKGKG